MLGWEFPPEISGGLGIANYNLCKALAPKTELILVLPKTDPNFRIPNVKVIDLSRLKIEEYFEEESLREFEAVIKEKRIAFDFTPYPQRKEVEKKRILKKEKKERSLRVKTIHNAFSTSELYGLDVYDKVRYYTEIVRRLASNLEFDIIHVHDWMTCPAGVVLQKDFRKPLVAHIHSLNVDRLGSEKRDWIFTTEKQALKNADIIIPVSQYTGSIIREFYRIPEKKIFPVHNGVEKVHPFRSEKNFPEKLILFMGRITTQKGPEFFLEAASRILERNDNVRFAVAGKGDKLQEIIESGAYSELGAKIHFTGFLNRTEVHHILSITDIFCMPSVSEPFGLAALEAAQFGIPVVLSKRSGVAEVLKGAMTVDFWDTEKMAEIIQQLLSDQELYDSAVKQGYKDLKKLTWAASARKVMALYSRIMN